MPKIDCPLGDAGVSMTQHGYYVCPTHGVVPYDWVIGAISGDRALTIMENWGVVVKRPKVKKERVDNGAPVSPGSSRIDDLLARLKTAMNPADKRKLRAALRKAGHVGGLKS